MALGLPSGSVQSRALGVSAPAQDRLQGGLTGPHNPGPPALARRGAEADHGGRRPDAAGSER